MKKFFKNDLIESICIGLSLILLWAPAAFVIADLNTEIFLTSYLYRTWMNFFGLLISLFTFYIFFDYIPGRKQRAWWIIGASVIIIIMLSVGYINWIKLGMLLNTYPKEEASMINKSYWLRAAIYQFYGIFYFVAIKLFLRYLRLKNKNQQLVLEKKASELNFLKSQTNPHFLFNTLNGIFALARDKSDLTADCVMRLSDILRYMLYETQAELISVTKEIEILEDYIELEKMRYDDSLKITFEKDIDNPEQQITPMLLIHLVENAFKHGASEVKINPSISISLIIKGNKLQFTVDNYIVSNDTSHYSKENIGLANLRRQLELLFKEHQLHIKRTENSFLVNLMINLNSYGKN